MRRGDIADIAIDGRQYKALFVGRGVYSKTFLLCTQTECIVVYYTKNDCTKEALSLLSRKVKHIPRVRAHHPVVIKSVVYNVYTSPYYRDVTKRDILAWRHYDEMKKLYNSYRSIAWKDISKGYEFVCGFVEYMKSVGTLPESLIEAFNVVLLLVINCDGTVYVDIKKNNFGVDDNGNLVLRDVFFILPSR